ncbi:D-isomer specific 2-hydroxyacid dehydrogenase [Hypoxylon sp. FL1284]|nr:D-isomer specific 2-hydroxyacid dehydrogenase [Hypoxylon sp. FL1284]
MAQNPNTHHVIVGLESFFVPVPPLTLPAPHTHELRQHERTAPSWCPPSCPSRRPRLRLVVVVAAGTDNVDVAACRARGVAVANAPRCNAAAVADHALALYFAARRAVVRSHARVQDGTWGARGMLQEVVQGPDGRPPRTTRDEVLGILGYGAVGQAIESLAKGLGMKILIAGRKGATAVPEGRTLFEDVLRESTVVVLCLPRSPESLGLISEPELALARRCAVLVNVSRGLIVDEEALVAALRAGGITGYATDVYAREPAGEHNSPLVGPDVADLNLITTPHVAWCAEDTIDNLNKALQENIVDWLTTGRPKYPVE